MRRIALLMIPLLLFFIYGKSQYQQFKISAKGDTINIIDKKGLKQGKWVTSVPEVRGEPGYDEEGIYKNDKKEGAWRKYSTTGDVIALENYRFGGKDGPQQYFSFLGQIEREEEWHSYDPNSPYDTIPVYGVGSDEILKYKIVKAQQYSVPDGEWKYYDAESGNVIKTEKYYRGLLLKDDDSKSVTDSALAANNAAAAIKDTSKVKPPEVLEYEKKLSKKKRAALSRSGETSL